MEWAAWNEVEVLMVGLEVCEGLGMGGEGPLLLGSWSVAGFGAGLKDLGRTK